jgi:hypothetical protein
MAWGKKKTTETAPTEVESVSVAVSGVLTVKSKYESESGYYSVQLEYPGNILDNNRIEKVDLRPRSQEEFDVFEPGQRVTIGVQPWITTPTEDALEEEEDLAS